LKRSTIKIGVIYQPDALQFKRVLFTQMIASLVLTVAALPFGTHVAVSALIGAVVCQLATAVFSIGVFRRYSAQRLDILVMRFYWAEIAKLAVIIGLFSLSFATVDGLNLPVVLVAYFVVQVLPTLFAPKWGAGSKPQR